MVVLLPGFAGCGLGEGECCEGIDPVLHILHELLQLLVYREVGQPATAEIDDSNNSALPPYRSA